MFRARAASEVDEAYCASTASPSCELLHCEEEACQEESCEAAAPRLPRLASVSVDPTAREIVRPGAPRRHHVATVATVLSGSLLLIALKPLSLGLFNHSRPAAELDSVQSKWAANALERRYIERTLVLDQGLGVQNNVLCEKEHCTQEECMDSCSKQPGCWSFSFGAVAGKCYLKSKIVKAQDAAATSEGSSDWKTFYVDLCGSRHADSTPIITAPALTKHELMGMGDVCLELKSKWPCRWTRDSPCKEQDDDGSLEHYCCCTRKRPRHATLSMYPFKKDHVLAPKGGNFKIKVLSYNLFWWKLFDIENGANRAAGKVVAKANRWLPHIDVIGFQECEDKNRVLKDGRILHLYATIQAPHAKCIAFRRKPWRLLSHGSEEIGHCVYWNDYGVYGAQWVRLQRKESGHILFFVNYHGPLSVNSGGACGGVATARNILRLINRRSQPGDVVILVGDFNSNPASLTLQELRKSMFHAYTGGVLGGIDNVLTNLPASAVVSNHDLGHGGSDHTAIASVFELGPRVSRQGSLHDAEKAMELSKDIVERMRNTMPIETKDWSKEWCGMIQPDTKFVVKKHGWAVTNSSMPSPDWCCKLCQRDSRCDVWLFVESNRNCHMMSGTVESAHKSLGFVSGLSAKVATEKVAKSYSGHAQIRALKYAPIPHRHIPHSHPHHHPHHRGNRKSDSGETVRM